MKNNEVKEQHNNYSYSDVLKAIYRMQEGERAYLLDTLKASEIAALLNTPSSLNEYCRDLYSVATRCVIVKDALEKLAVSLENCPDVAKEFSSDYDKLSESEKMQTALEMLNNKDFQKNCCDIIVGDYERIVAEDPTCNALNKLLGISKYFRKCIETGLGCDHKYAICDKNATEAVQDEN